jgi:hypothetical protein
MVEPENPGLSISAQGLLRSINADREAKSVTARVPMLATQIATYVEGRGCLLEPWAQ